MISAYLGIDPGLSGGFAVVSSDKIRYKMAMPTISITTREGETKTEIDCQGVLSFLKKLPEHTHVAIEEQKAFRGQDITRTCTTCRNYGILLGVLSAAHMYITEVPSDVWQEHFGIVSVKKGEGESTKEQAFQRVQTLYPGEDFRKSERSRTFHDGVVDATLIAKYCQDRFAPFLQLIEPLDVKTIHGEECIVKTLECKPGRKVSGTKLKREMF